MTRLLRLRSTVAIIALAISAASVQAGEVVLDTKGEGSARTAIFKVDGPWLLTWRINSDYRAQSSFELNLLDAETGFFHSRVIRRPTSLNGLKLFRETGKFRFEIDAALSYWTLVVEQLTEAEADALVPVEQR